MPAKGKNAYVYFAIEFKKRAESNGRTFANGLKDVFTDEQCSREWKEMPEQMKQKYKAMAKQQKFNGTGQHTMEKRTCTGQIISSLKNREEEEALQNEAMYSYIENTVSSGWTYGTLPHQKFIFIHVNYFCEKQLPNNTQDYYPAEFAVGEFLLKDGLGDVYHEIVRENLPLGYRKRAIDISEETHGIPPEMEGAEEDFDRMGEKLRKLIGADTPGTRFPPMFTTKKTIPVVRSLLRRMFPDHDDTVQPFLIYQVEALFQVLLNVILQNAELQNDRAVSVTALVAQRILQKDIFAYERGIECDFHRSMDSAIQYCSKSIIKRWSYTICDYICEGFKIEKIPGIHCPVNQNLRNTVSVVSPRDDITNDFVTAFETGCCLPTGSSAAATRERGKVGDTDPEGSRESGKEEDSLPERMAPKKLPCNPMSANSAEIGQPSERPLRLPKTISRAEAMLHHAPEKSPFDLNPDQRFVSIGRGKHQHNHFSTDQSKHLGGLGRGRIAH